MNIKRFLQQLHNTKEEEILCSECLDQINRYVDLELDGLPVVTLLGHLTHHLNQCPVCHEEYTIVRDLALMERNGDPRSLDDLGNSFPE